MLSSINKHFTFFVFLFIITTVGVTTIGAATITQSGITKLAVPYYAQEHTNTCEAASLRMALAYYGIKQRDMDIVKRFGYNPNLKDMVNNIWDDPQRQFVGFVDSTGPGQGYGVYGSPVTEAVLSYGKNADYYTDASSITASMLATEIRLGHPVIVWGYTSIREKPYTWKTREGKEVTAFKGEHARLVVGVSGPTSNPTGFYVHDSFTKQKYLFIKTADLLKQISSVPGVTDQAVVVR